MKQFLRLAAFLATFGFVPLANAATCFWVGGTGSWSTANAASWSSGTGGAGSTCAATGGIPKQAADVATFDGASGGGTVTVDSTLNGVTLTQITAGAFTGTLDFSANNPSMTLTASFSITGAGTRTINLGSGTFTLPATNANNWDATTVTGLTFNAGTSTILIPNGANGNAATFVGGGLTYSTLSLGARASGSGVSISGNNTFATLLVAGPININLTGGATQTITNAIAWNGSSSALIAIFCSSATKGTLAVAVGSVTSWSALKNITFTGTTVAATSSFDLGGNTGVTITAPSGGGGGGRIIGG